MRPTDKKKEMLPACGYGLLGLCCSGCLLGPCRLSPFEQESLTGLCGMNADALVAQNLLRFVQTEAAWEISRWRALIIELQTWNPPPPAQKGEARWTKKILFEKYGLSPRLPLRKAIQVLLREVRNFISPVPEGHRSFLFRFFPQKAWPSPFDDHSQPISLTQLLLNSWGRNKSESSGVEGPLQECLDLSLIVLLSQRLREDLRLLIEKKETFPGERVSTLLGGIAVPPPPFIVVLSESESLLPEPEQRQVDELLPTLDKAFPLIRLRNTGALADLGQEVSASWSLAIPDIRVVVLVTTTKVTTVLGALALGFKVTSIPPLPIHGSKEAEEFFLEGLRRKFGNTYLLSWEGDLSSKILDFLA
ncbi:MAG: hypothetical protein KKH04_01900 [Proteobacteria bacterium]|nr:hypothetical protein [Pseudomonadota bacterium]